MFHRLPSFLRDESGAVTVDWVVLTAATAGIGIAVIGAVSSGFQSQSTSLERALENDHVFSTFEEANALALQYRNRDEPDEE